jgi:glycosyltransferase involved in cell wall biosynthesis
MDEVAPTVRPNILIIGPGPEEIGGVATFIQFIRSSAVLNRKFDIQHMDTSRGQKNQSTAGRLSYLNLTLLMRQVHRLIFILAGYKPQVVHFNVTAGWSFWKTALFILISHLFHIKTIAHIHGGDFNLFVDSLKSISRRLAIATLKKADAVVVLSSWWQSYIQAIVKAPINVIVISNAPENALINATDPDRVLIDRKGNTIIFVGSIGRRKGIFDILEAIPFVIEDHECARFLFLGEEEIAGEKQKILQICGDPRIQEHVCFLGWVTGEKKRACYQEADIFILPSYAENLPFALLEAMAVGLPVVTTPVGGIPEIIQDGENGFLIEPGSKTQLKERILQLLKDPQLRQRLGKNAQKTIIESFAPGKIDEQWAALYSRMCETSHA